MSSTVQFIFLSVAYPHRALCSSLDTRRLGLSFYLYGGQGKVTVIEVWWGTALVGEDSTPS